MDAAVTIGFKVTPSQKETKDFRVTENGFDDISAYVKVVALKTKAFNFTSEVPTSEEPSIELGFKVTPSQKTLIEQKAKESGCEYEQESGHALHNLLLFAR